MAINLARLKASGNRPALQVGEVLPRQRRRWPRKTLAFLLSRTATCGAGSNGRQQCPFAAPFLLILPRDSGCISVAVGELALLVARHRRSVFIHASGPSDHRRPRLSETNSPRPCAARGACYSTLPGFGSAPKFGCAGALRIVIARALGGRFIPPIIARRLRGGSRAVRCADAQSGVVITQRGFRGIQVGRPLPSTELRGGLLSNGSISRSQLTDPFPEVPAP